MNYCFSFKERHTVTSANKNVYVKPAIHPSRCINQHDFIYILDGAWQIGIGDWIYDVKKDDVIILPANMFHYGTAYSAENTKTFFLHSSLAEGDGATTAETAFLTNTKCCIPTVVNTSCNTDVKNIFSSIIFSFKQNNQLKTSVLFDTLLLTLFEICEYKTKNNKIAYKIKNIIDENLHKTINTSYIAEKLNKSKKSVEVKFK